MPCGSIARLPAFGILPGAGFFIGRGRLLGWPGSFLALSAGPRVRLPFEAGHVQRSGVSGGKGLSLADNDLTKCDRRRPSPVRAPVTYTRRRTYADRGCHETLALQRWARGCRSSMLSESGSRAIPDVQAEWSRPQRSRT